MNSDAQFAGERRCRECDKELAVTGDGYCRACDLLTWKAVNEIRTSHDYPPIPYRGADWNAVTDNYDGAPDAGPQLCGHGASELDALAALREQMEQS